MLPAAVLGLLASAAVAELPPPSAETVGVRFAWLDDGIAGLEIPGQPRVFPIVIDDNGFTNGFELGTAYGPKERWLSLDARLLNLTERPAPGAGTTGLRRWDSLDLVAGVAWAGQVGLLDWWAMPRLGLAFGGNFGGLWLQSGFHLATGWSGRTEGHGLQNVYGAEDRVGVTVGGRAQGTLALTSWVFLRGRADAQLALGQTGVSLVSGEVRAGVAKDLGPVRPYGWISLQAAAWSAIDPELRLPGGYVPGPALTPGLTLGVVWQDLAVAWQLVLNDHGTGYPNGAVIVEYGRLRRDAP